MGYSLRRRKKRRGAQSFTNCRMLVPALTAFSPFVIDFKYFNSMAESKSSYTFIMMSNMRLYFVVRVSVSGAFTLPE